MLVETIFGAAGALIVLLLVFGSALALMPLADRGRVDPDHLPDRLGPDRAHRLSFIVQFLLALIGLGVAIDYALLIVTRWREELGHGLDHGRRGAAGAWRPPAARCSSPG